MYAHITPIFGILMAVMAFPMAWFNEVRAAAASGSASHSPVPTEDKNKSKDNEALLDKEKGEMDTFEAGAPKSLGCNLLPCALAKGFFKKLPASKSKIGDPITWAFRLLTAGQLWLGLDMILAPLYYTYEYHWDRSDTAAGFFVVLMSAHMTWFLTKTTILWWSGTVGLAAALPRSKVAAMVVAGIIAVVAILLLMNWAHWIYWEERSGKMYRWAYRKMAENRGWFI